MSVLTGASRDADATLAGTKIGITSGWSGCRFIAKSRGRLSGLPSTGAARPSSLASVAARPSPLAVAPARSLVDAVRGPAPSPLWGSGSSISLSLSLSHGGMTSSLSSVSSPVKPSPPSSGSGELYPTCVQKHLAPPLSLLKTTKSGCILVSVNPVHPM